MSDSNLRHFLGVKDLSSQEIETIFFRAREFKEKGFSSSAIFRQEPASAPIVALAFFEPSTRTKLSFDAAAQRIGCKTIGFDNPASTSSAKGEQLQDTIRVIEKYSDVLVIRRKEHDTPEVIKSVATKPVISAGVGAQEHPTQALLDIFTISEHRNLDSLSHVVSYGDLINSRTMFSQVRLLAKPGRVFSFVAPDDMQIHQEFIDEIKGTGAEVYLYDKLDSVIGDADVLSVIRPQKERWDTDPKEMYNAVTADTLSKMKSDALILHALPRTGELSPETDSDSRSLIFDQVENGIYIRAALLEWLLTL